MRVYGRVTVVALLVALLAVPALAWELSMKGDAEWRYRYWTRTGDVDIFGPMDGTTVYLGINHLKTFPTTGTQNPLSSHRRQNKNARRLDPSFRRKPESSLFNMFWTPAFAGVTGLHLDKHLK